MFLMKSYQRHHFGGFENGAGIIDLDYLFTILGFFLFKHIGVLLWVIIILE